MSAPARMVDWGQRADVTDGTAKPGAVPRWNARLTLLVLAAGLVLQVVWRLALVDGRVGPLALPDEAGYLLDARVLSHGLPADMSGWPLYRGGYPLLVTPVYWLTHDPRLIYRGVLVVNAVLNAVVFPLTYLFARRVSQVSRSLALPLAFAVALLPGVVFYSQYALSDAVLPVVVMGWLLCVGLWLQEDGRSRSRSGFAAAVLAAYSDAVHARGAVFIAVFAALLLVAYLRRWDERRRIAQIAGIFVVAVVAVMWFNSWTASQNWPRGAEDLSNGLVAHLTSWHGLGRTALVSLGELWALSVSTLGFGIVAVVAPWRRAWHDAGWRPLVVVPTMAAVAVIGVAVAAAGAGIEERRVGNWVEPRFVGCLAPVLIVCGVAALARSDRRSAARLATTSAAVFVAAACIVGTAAHHQLHSYYFVQFDFPETSPLTRSWSSLHLGQATLVVFALFALCVVATLAAARWRWVVLTLVFAAVGSYSGVANKHHITDAWQRQVYPHDRTFLDAAGVRPGTPVAVQACCWGTVPEIQWESWWGTVSFVRVDRAHPPAGFDVVVVTSKPPMRVTWSGWRRAVTTGEWTVWARGTTPAHVRTTASRSPSSSRRDYGPRTGGH